MPRGPRTFKQCDVKAAVNAIEKLGKNVAAIEIKKDGTIRIDVGDPNIGADRKLPTRRNNPLDYL
jgi:hypothetical protein